MKGKRLHFNRKKVSGIALLAIVALIIIQLPFSEAEAASSASDFKMEGNKLVKYRGTEKSVSVPATVEVIGESAFEGDTNIELVVLPNSVKRIEAYAFWGCDNLETVILGRGLKEVGDYSFTNCTGLERMTVPENVSFIGIQAFADCVNMKDITIAPEVTSIHETAFDGCYNLTIHADAGSVADKYAAELYERQKEMPGYGESSEGAGEDQGRPQDMQDMNEGNSGGQAEGPSAENSPETDPDIQSSDTGSGTEGNILGSTHVVGNQAVVLMNNTSPKVLQGQSSTPSSGASDSAQQGAEAGENQDLTARLFAETGGIPKYTIVDGKIVADYAYYGNKTLKQISLPQGIEEIGQFSFARSSVTRAFLPEGAKTVGYGAFYHCDDLREVSLPETVLTVEPKAFMYTAWLQDFLEDGGEASAAAENSLNGTSEQDDFLISGGVLVAYRGSGSQAVIPEGVRVVAGEAFSGHDELQSVIFPDSLVSVGENAFAGTSLETATLPDSVEYVGARAFPEKVQLVYEGEDRPETEEEAANYEFVVRPIEPQAGEQVPEKLDLAFERALGQSVPEDAFCYDVQPVDENGAVLRQTDGSPFTVTLPVPEEFADREVQIFITDRNGQLEIAHAQRGPVQGVDSLYFTLKQATPFAVCGK